MLHSKFKFTLISTEWISFLNFYCVSVKLCEFWFLFFFYQTGVSEFSKSFNFEFSNFSQQQKNREKIADSETLNLINKRT
jgi:hypothetical protein